MKRCRHFVYHCHPCSRKTQDGPTMLRTVAHQGCDEVWVFLSLPLKQKHMVLPTYAVGTPATTCRPMQRAPDSDAQRASNHVAATDTYIYHRSGRSKRRERVSPIRLPLTHLGREFFVRRPFLQVVNPLEKRKRASVEASPRPPPGYWKTRQSNAFALGLVNADCSMYLLP